MHMLFLVNCAHGSMPRERSFNITCEEALCFLRQNLTTDAPKLLIIVDGPPAATGKHARYPALPIVTHVLGDTSTYHFVMDDYLRGDEREIVALWKEALASLNIPFNQTDFNQLENKLVCSKYCPNLARLINTHECPHRFWHPPRSHQDGPCGQGSGNAPLP